MKGVVADLPGVLEGTGRRFQASGLSNRCDTVLTNFFESVPASGDAYLMKHIIHDWDDERAAKILQNCHRAMGGRGKLLLIEIVIPPGNGPDFGKWLDIGMLVLTGGLERTADEYRDLLASAGFQMTRIVPTQSPVSVIEAIPV